MKWFCDLNIVFDFKGIKLLSKGLCIYLVFFLPFSIVLIGLLMFDFCRQGSMGWPRPDAGRSS